MNQAGWTKGGGIKESLNTYTHTRQLQYQGNATPVPSISNPPTRCVIFTLKLPPKNVMMMNSANASQWRSHLVCVCVWVRVCVYTAASILLPLSFFSGFSSVQKGCYYCRRRQRRRRWWDCLGFSSTNGPGVALHHWTGPGVSWCTCLLYLPSFIWTRHRPIPPFIVECGLMAFKGHRSGPGKRTSGSPVCVGVCAPVREDGWLCILAASTDPVCRSHSRATIGTQKLRREWEKNQNKKKHGRSKKKTRRVHLSHFLSLLKKRRRRSRVVEGKMQQNSNAGEALLPSSLHSLRWVAVNSAVQ